MRRAIWMNAWDVVDSDPGAVLGEMEKAGLNAANLGLLYHGGRSLLTRNPARVVYEQRPSGLHFPLDPAGIPKELRPEVTEDCSRFLDYCDRQDFDIRAWLVLCHNDELAARAPQFAIRNAFGEACPYALCPAHPEVMEYCVQICRQAAAVRGVRGLDLEALSFHGYEHVGLHDRVGIPLPAAAVWLLSICCCGVCSSALPGVGPELQYRIRKWLANPYVEPEPWEDAPVIAWRRKVQMRLLRRIREACPDSVLNLRTSLNPRFSGGKTSLPLTDLPDLADEVTLSYFWTPLNVMRRELSALARPGRIAIHGGMTFHEPDCRCEEDVRARLSHFIEAGLDGLAFYNFGVPAGIHFEWLRGALEGAGLS